VRRILVAVLVAAAGCSGGDSAGLSVEDPWARPNPSVATNAAFFFTLVNTGDTPKTLVSATSEACRVIELHESTMTDGVMSMQQVAGGIVVPASQTVLLQPGGKHVMCIDKGIDFADGEEIELTLQFLSGDGTAHEETVTAVVEDR
jgi:copper(I)-binding protein